MTVKNPYINRYGSRHFGKSVKKISISISQETFKKLEKELEFLNKDHPKHWSRSNLIEAYINEQIKRK